MSKFGLFHELAQVLQEVAVVEAAAHPIAGLNCSYIGVPEYEQLLLRARNINDAVNSLSNSLIDVPDHLLIAIVDLIFLGLFEDAIEAIELAHLGLLLKLADLAH